MAVGRPASTDIAMAEQTFIAGSEVGQWLADMVPAPCRRIERLLSWEPAHEKRRDNHSNYQTSDATRTSHTKRPFDFFRFLAYARTQP